MRKATAWAVIAIVAVIAALVLGFVATVRFAMAPVDPAPPPPDYAVQSSIATVFLLAVVGGAALAGVHAARRERDRGRIVAWTAIILIAGAVVGSILAFTLS